MIPHQARFLKPRGKRPKSGSSFEAGAFEGGCSSVVEQKLPKLRVESSILFTRSIAFKDLAASDGRLSH
jgi:hypothetical protein